MWEGSEGPKPRLREALLADGGAGVCMGGGRREGKVEIGGGA